MMSQNSDYKNIKELITAISNGIQELESGKMNQKKLGSLLDNSRNLHERIAILQYLAFEKEVKASKTPKKKSIKQETPHQGSFQLNFGAPKEKVEELDIEENEDIHPNQINLIDAIEEEQNEVIEEEVSPEIEEDKSEELEENITQSINEKFAQQTESQSLAQKLSAKPIEKLADSISLHEKFLFINELFEGENTFYNEAIEMLDSLVDNEKANEYTDQLKTKYNWNMSDDPVVKFTNLIYRRFS